VFVSLLSAFLLSRDFVNRNLRSHGNYSAEVTRGGFSGAMGNWGFRSVAEVSDIQERKTGCEPIILNGVEKN
jgi:hypothetical protein